jgi:outer membrane protein assembly factor BamB
MVKASTLLLCSILLLISCGRGDRGKPPPTRGQPPTSVPIVEVEQGEVYVDLYNPEKTCDGTTLFTDGHDPKNPRIIEVNMPGEIVWEYVLPDNLKRYTQPGFDAEVLSNNNVLIVLPKYGIQEIDRDGNVVWTHRDEKISHDADRLPNGNTIFVFGDNDKKDDAQVKEVNPQGDLVWDWYAKGQFNVTPYDTLERQGWTHTNAVTRLENGNTLISPRNFSLTIEVNPQGEVVWSVDWTALFEGASDRGYDPHEPEILPNNHLLVCLQWETPYQAVEIDRNSGEVVWKYDREGLRTARDCDRLPNGNTLIVGVVESPEDSVIFEVTPQGEIVWELKLKDTPAERSPGWFYKAQRMCQGD